MLLRWIVVITGAVGMLISPGISAAGMNPEGKLAMHLIASADSLGWEDLVPAACESIDADLSAAELFEAGGYGYILLLAYDVEAVSGVEFAISGWPTARGAPVLNGPHWIEEDATTFGDHLAAGGATGLGTCAEPDTTGLTPLAYLTFGPLDSTDVPITLSYIPSTYTEPEDSLLAVTDCMEEYVADRVVLATGCAIGGTYTGPTPECGGRSEGGEGEAGGGEDFEWPVVVETGILYLYGNRLAAPYVFTFENDELFVNGVRLIPPLHRASQPDVNVTDLDRARHALSREAMGVAMNVLETGSSRDSVVAGLAREYRSSSLVDSVSVGEDGTVWVHWAGSVSEAVSVPHELPRARRPRVVVCGDFVSSLGKALQRGGVEFVGAGYRVGIPLERLPDLEEEMRILRQSNDPRAESLSLIYGCVGRDLLDPMAVRTGPGEGSQ